MQLAPLVDITSQTLGIADGKPGVFQTVALMRRLINQYKTAPVIRQTAGTIIFLAPEKSPLHEIESLFAFVQQSIRYTRDVSGVETLQTPDKTLAMRYGDCDDQTTLFCALAESIGYATRLVVAGYHDPRVYEHVYAQVAVGPEWIDADPTEDFLLGYAPPDPLVIWFESR